MPGSDVAASGRPVARRRRLLAFAALAAAVSAFVPGRPAAAHPNDELLQQVYITPAAAGVTVDVELTPGVLAAPAFARLVDTDGDGAFSEAETASYIEVVRAAVSVRFGDTAAPVRSVHAAFADAGVLGAGGGSVAVTFAADRPPGAGGALSVTAVDAYEPALRSTVQGSVTLSTDRSVSVAAVEHSQDGRALTVRYDVAPSGATPTASGGAGAPGPTVTTGLDASVATPAAAVVTSGGRASYLLASLQEPLGSAWALVALLAASAGLGALHALTPGHGKTLLAAYLVGKRGTPRQAVALGAAVTATHTASVIAIGVAVLVAGRYVVPGVLVPGLEVLAGALVVLLGVRLVGRRWRDRRATNRHTHHDHDHAHTHHHGGSGHVHGPAGDEPLGWRGLVALGVSGGIVPCPEALGVLLLAVALHRTLLGIGMIVAFSAGLAAVLVGLGLVLVTARLGRWLRDRTGRGRLATMVPLASALVVTVLGVAMALRGAGALAAR